MKQLKSWPWLIFMAALMAPNVYYVSHSNFYGGALDALQFLLFAAIALVVPLFLLRIRFFIVLMTPILFLVPLALMHVALLGRPMSTGMIVSMLYGTQNEAWTIIKSSPLQVALSLIILASGLTAARYIFRKNLVLGRELRQRLAFCICGGYLLLSWPLDSYNASSGLLENPIWKLHLILGDREDSGRGDLFPLGLVSRLGRVAWDSSRLEQWKVDRLTYKWQITRKRPIVQPEIHVLVIGEAARRDHMQIYGYHRPTTPQLAKEKDLIALTQIVSPANVTIYAVRQLLTRARPHDIDRSYQEPSIINVYKDSGFKTFWISNSEMIDKHSTPITMFANDSDLSLFTRDPYEVTLDTVLVDRFDSVMKDPSPKKFIVIHMKGSHFDYSQRYSADFETFKPSYLGKSLYGWRNLQRKQELINSYDNTIVFTDFVLGQILSRLKGASALASMTFVSDHGERLMDLGGGDILHSSAQGSRAELEVPFFVWLSPSYQKEYPEKLPILRSNKDHLASSFILFDTLLGLGGLDIEGHAAPDNIFSPDFRGTPRPVLLPTGKVVDYDSQILVREAAARAANSQESVSVD